MRRNGRAGKRGSDRTVLPPYGHRPTALPGSAAAGFDAAGVPPCHGALPVRHRFAILRLALAEVIKESGAMTSKAA